MFVKLISLVVLRISRQLSEHPRLLKFLIEVVADIRRMFIDVNCTDGLELNLSSDMNSYDNSN